MSEKKEISQKIINYTIWYYLKYFPSVNKLRQKLDFKFGPNSEKGKKYGGIFEEDIDYIINKKMGSILCEKEIIDAKIRNFIFKGKSRRYIAGKLFEKGFRSEDFEDLLEKYFINGESENLERAICKKIQLQNIDECRKEFKKLDFKNQTKITQSLVGKGFNYQDIREALS